MPDDAHAHRDPSRKTGLPAHPDETSELLARCRPVRRHGPAISEMSLLEFSNSRNPRLARSAAPRRSSGRLPTPPASAPHPANRIDCCPVGSARPRRASASSTESRRLSRAPPASACRRLRHPDAHPPASAALSSANAAASTSAPPYRFPGAAAHNNDRLYDWPARFQPSVPQQSTRWKPPPRLIASQSQPGCTPVQISSASPTCPSDGSSPKKGSNIFRPALSPHPLRRRKLPLAFRRLLHNLPELRFPAHARQQRIRQQCLVRTIVLRHRLTQKRICNLLLAASRQHRALVVLQLRILLRQQFVLRQLREPVHLLCRRLVQASQQQSPQPHRILRHLLCRVLGFGHLPHAHEHRNSHGVRPLRAGIQFQILHCAIRFPLLKKSKRARTPVVVL